MKTESITSSTRRLNPCAYCDLGSMCTLGDEKRCSMCSRIEGTVPTGRILGRAFRSARVLQLQHTIMEGKYILAKLDDSRGRIGGTIAEILCPMCLRTVTPKKTNPDLFLCGCGQKIRLEEIDGEFVGWL